MSLTKTLLKAGAVYAVSRAVRSIKKEDVEKLTGISADDVKRYGLDRLDNALHGVGLRRESSITSSTVLVLGGFAAGAIVGAGATYLFSTERGKELRKEIAEFLSRTDSEEKADEKAETADGKSPAQEGLNGEAAAASAVS